MVTKLRRLEIPLSGMLLLALLLGLGYFLLNVGIALRHPYTLDYGEGPLLNHARSLATGQEIYRADLTGYPYTVTNYPPLYVGLWASLGELFGLSYAVGRAITAVAALTSALLIALILGALTGDRLAAAVGGLTFLCFPFVLFWSSLARVDLTALALSLAGMWVAVRARHGAPAQGWPRRTWSAVVAAILMTGAAFTRQSYLLAGPLAVAGWLWTRRRRQAVVFGLTLALGTLICFGGLNLWTGGGAFFNLVTANANRFSLDRLAEFFSTFALAAGLLLPIALLELTAALRRSIPRNSNRRAAHTLPLLYLAGGSLSALTVGKVGSGVNYFLELIAALALITGVALARRSPDARGRDPGRPALTRSVLLAALLFQTVWMLYLARLLIGLTEPRLQMRPQVAQLEQLVAAETRPVLADEHLGLLVLQGREVWLQPFEFRLLAREGKWDQGQLLNDLRTGRFGLILISDHPPAFSAAAARGRWTDEMWDAIRATYVPTQVLAGTTVYRPRR